MPFQTTLQNLQQFLRHTNKKRGLDQCIKREGERSLPPFTGYWNFDSEIVKSKPYSQSLCNSRKGELNLPRQHNQTS